MRRRPLLVASFFLVLFFAALVLRRSAPPPCLAFAEGRVAYAVGRDLRGWDPSGRALSTERLPSRPDRLIAWGGLLAYQPKSSRGVLVRGADGSWTADAPPPASTGEGRWASGAGKIYYLQLRPATVWCRDAAGSAWRPFLAEDEDVENPVDLAPLGDGLVLLNRDPQEAVEFDARGRSLRRFQLTRDRLWPLQRPVFEGALDYFRVRHCDVPRRLWAREDGSLSILFSTEDGEAPRWVVLFPQPSGTPLVREGVLAVRSEALRRSTHLCDIALLPGGTFLATSDGGGLWSYDEAARLTGEWLPLKAPPPPWKKWSAVVGTWGLLLASLVSLAAAAWPRRESDRGARIPPSAWWLGIAGGLVPGLGQALQRRWGWAVFWALTAGGWGVLALDLTRRIRSGAFVTPATYVETLLALLLTGLLAGLQAFREEYLRGKRGEKRLSPGGGKP